MSDLLLSVLHSLVMTALCRPYPLLLLFILRFLSFQLLTELAVLSNLLPVPDEYLQAEPQVSAGRVRMVIECRLTKGIRDINALKIPNSVQAQAIPRFSNSGFAANGRTTPTIERDADVAPIALAA